MHFKNRALETLLGLALVALVAQLGWPGIHRWWQRATPGHIVVEQVGRLVASSGTTSSLSPEYLLFLPQDYHALNQNWPLVLFLHGNGGRGSEVRVLQNGPFQYVQRNRSFPAILAAPQCRKNRTWEPRQVVALVAGLTKAYRVDPSRIYLVGFSMGGYGTWQTGVSYPELFAALVPISGGGDEMAASNLVNMPIWAFHGATDQTVPPSESHEMIDAIRSAGGSPKLTILPEAGHDIRGTVCRREDLWQWLFQQHLSHRGVGPIAETDSDTAK